MLCDVADIVSLDPAFAKDAVLTDLAGEIAILTGPPGAGKTTAAGAFARTPGAPKVHLHADDFWRFIQTGAIEPYLPTAHAQNEIVVGILAQTAAGYARGGYLVIVDGIIGPWFLPPFVRLHVPVHYLVLRPPLAVAIERCRARGGNTMSDPEPITALHEQFSAMGALESHVIETGGRDRRHMLDAIGRALSSGAFRLSRESGAATQ